MSTFDPNTFGDDTPDPTMSDAVEGVREDGTRTRNADQPIPLDLPEELDDPVADQMAAELTRLGYKDADADPPVGAEESVPTTVPASDDAVPVVDEAAATGETEPPAEQSLRSHVIDFGEHGKVSLNDTELRDIVIRDAYFSAKPPETWAVLNDIESGAKVPISRQEYDEYRAFKSRPATPTATPAAPLISDDDLQYLEPDVQARIRALQVLHTQAPLPAPEPAPAAEQPAYVSPAQIAQEQARLQSINTHVETALASLKSTHNLSDEELAEVNQYAVQSNLVGRYSSQHSTHLPDGTVIATDYPSLFTHVLDDAFTTHPKFRQRLIDEEVQKRLDHEQTSIRKTNDKRALAGSIASAPSAALTSPSAPLTDRAALTAAIAEEIRRSQSG